MLVSEEPCYGQKGNKVELAICIPNYNRPDKLYRLLRGLADQITEGKMTDHVEICISDDRSPESPEEVVKEIRHLYSDVRIIYHVNETNMGMDYNFMQSVRIADGEYCWIIGNDDEPEEGALRTILKYISKFDETVDVIVSSFHIYDEGGNVLQTIIPLIGKTDQPLYFHTDNREEYANLIDRVKDGNALFCFLSNVIFRKSRWMQHGRMFDEKMNTIFIQMYMNLQTLKEGAVYAYIPDKVIKNHGDKVINETFKREYDVLVGLSGVIDFFFEGKEHDMLQNRIVDSRINGRMWSLPDNSPLKVPILRISSKKNECYRKYYVRPEERGKYFDGKNVILYGAGNFGSKAMEELSQYHLKSLTVYDSDPLKQGCLFYGHRIKSTEGLLEEYTKNNSIVIVANNLALADIIEMLVRMEINNIALIV